ncbi:MAG: SIS domain-containing protein [Angustibacter sp.]
MSPVSDGLLDDLDAIEASDPTRVLRELATAGAQVRSSAVRGAEAGVRAWDGGRPRSVLVASLGGSAAVADVLALLAGAGSPVPVTIRRGLPLPGWVGPMDLVVAVSVSGHARGPLALAAEAGRRGAQLLTVGAPDSPLAAVCAQARGVHVPMVRLSPDGQRVSTSSRTSFWSLLVPVLQAADALGVVDVPDEVLDRVADRLDAEAEACRPASESFVNPAKMLATQLIGSVPVMLGDGLVTGVAARRAAAMLARTARTPAVHGSLPDDASEVVATFDGPFTAAEQDVFADPFLDDPGSTAPRLRLVLLREPAPEPGVDEQEAFESADLADQVRAMAQEVGVAVSEIVADRGHPLERLAGLVARTDFAATYLALARGWDPGSSPHVADLRDAR